MPKTTQRHSNSVCFFVVVVLLFFLFVCFFFVCFFFFFFFFFFGTGSLWAALRENMSKGVCGQQRPRSACASAQSDQGLYCPQTESLDTIERFNGEQMPG